MMHESLVNRRWLAPEWISLRGLETADLATTPRGKRDNNSSVKQLNARRMSIASMHESSVNISMASIGANVVLELLYNMGLNSLTWQQRLGGGER
jgi:hypothetical protein